MQEERKIALKTDHGLGRFIHDNWPKKISSRILYHYTSRDVLPCFVRANAALFCTRIDELNDKNENRWGFAYLARYLRRTRKWSRSDIVQLHKYCMFLMDAAKECLPGSMSFSRVRNNDALWNKNGYVSKETGGYSIGFCQKDIVENACKINAESTDHELLLVPIFYIGDDSDAIDSIIEFYLSEIIGELKVCMNHPEQWTQHIFVISRLLLFPLFVKGKVWSDEEESRLIFIYRGRMGRCKTFRLGGKDRYRGMESPSKMIMQIDVSPFPPCKIKELKDNAYSVLKEQKLHKRIAVE